MDWQPFDPTWLVELAHQRLPDRPWVEKVLRHCTRAAVVYDVESRAKCIYFVDPSSPNQPGADWQIADIVELEVMEGEIVDVILDLLQGDRVGGVEILHRPGWRPPRP